MKTLRTLALCVTGLLCLAASMASAQTWPNRPIKLVIGFPPGPADLVGRPLAAKLQEALGQPVVIENRPGANGAIATEQVMRSEPDGYTILLGTSGTHVTAVHLVKNLPYDPVKDFMPVAAVVEPATALLVANSLPVKSIKELIEYGKANPGKLTYGSSGVGSVFHLAGELFKQTTGTEMVHVAYRGAEAPMQDVIAGHIPMTFTAVSTGRPHALAGTARMLAVLEPERFSGLPDVPSMSEAVPAFKKPKTFFGVYAPLKTPAPIIERLNAEVNKAINSPDIKALFEQNGYAILGGPPDRLREMMVDGIARFGQVIQSAGIKPE